MRVLPWLGSCCIQVSIRHIPTQTPVDPFYILLFFTENLGFFRFFRFFSSIFGFFSVSFGCFASIPKQFKREYIWVFFRKFKVVSVCFGLLRNSSVCFDCFDIGSKHRNKQNFLVFGFTKQTETNAKQILFRFVSVRTEIYFC